MLSEQYKKIRQNRLEDERKHKEELLKRENADISKCNLIEKVFRKGRWFATLDCHYKGRKTMPHAHYVWLKGNPRFSDIPKGYVVHHLDHDEQNDDISNLVLMLKSHHIAHHWKQNGDDSDVKIKFDWESANVTELNPITEPKVYQIKDTGVYYVQVWEETIKGKRPTKVYRHNGNKFRTKEAAENFKALIWP